MPNYDIDSEYVNKLLLNARYEAMKTRENLGKQYIHARECRLKALRQDNLKKVARCQEIMKRLFPYFQEYSVQMRKKERGE